MDKAEEIPEPLDFGQYTKRRNPVFIPPKRPLTAAERTALFDMAAESLKDLDFDAYERRREWERNRPDAETQ